MHDSLFDEFVLVPQPVLRSLPHDKSIPILKQPSHIDLPRWIIRLETPILAEPIGVQHAMEAMQKHHGMLLATPGTLNPTSPSERRRQILSIPVDCMPTAKELNEAFAVEVQFCETASIQKTIATQGRIRLPGLPIDILDVQSLGRKFELLRRLIRPGVPLGVAIPIGSLQEDIELILECGAQFITLLQPCFPGVDRSDVSRSIWALSKAKRVLSDKGRSHVALIVEMPIRHGRDLALIFALGANGVILDPWISSRRDLIREKPTEKRSGNLLELDSMRPLRDQAVPNQLASAIEELIQQAERTAQSCGCQSIEQLGRTQVAAMTERAHRLTDIPWLS